jgi:hypothetical protein
MKRSSLLQFFVLAFLTGTCFAWQQRVAYDIEARLDTVEHKIYAVQHLRYFNNSPDTLSSVWFHLYPNAFKDVNTIFAREAERNEDYSIRHSSQADRGYIEINSLLISGVQGELKYGPDPTTANLTLPEPLAPGDSADFDFEFAAKVPDFFIRIGHRGSHYEISQWYPKIAVYDSKGWHAEGYHYIGEFYGDYGSFQVGLTVPKNMKVGATGVEIIADEDDQQSGESEAYFLYAADNVHDFTWCADPNYQVNTEQYGEVSIKVMSESSENWKNVMQYAKDALDYYGRWYGAYPYQTLTVCKGDVGAGGGMEYPNLVIVSVGNDKIIRVLESVVVHEIGHQWFYGILGNNEMDEPWLDEGINTFSEERYFREKYGDEGNYLINEKLKRFMPQANSRYIGQMVNYVYSANKMNQPVLTRSFKSSDIGQYAASAYMKPANMIWWLNSYLGKSSFDKVMQGYYRDNRFKHVTTEDFFESVKKYSSRDIKPYFEPWLKSIGMGDYSTASLKRIPEIKNAYRVKLSREGGFALPVEFAAEDMTDKRYDLFWSGVGRDTNFILQAEGELVSAGIDPDNCLLETNRWNNYRPKKYKITLGPRFPDFDTYSMFWLPVPWYDNINGFRMGAMLHGAYMADSDPMVGRHQWTFSPFYGFKSKEISFSADYQTLLGSRPRPPRIYLTAGSAFDINYAGMGLKRTWGPRLLFDPTESYDVRLDYTRYKDYRFWDPRDVDTAAVLSLIAQRGYNLTRHWGRSVFLSTVTVGYIQRPEVDINNFLKLELEDKLSLRMNKWLKLKLRLASGYIQGPAPAQEQFFLAGSFKTAGLDNMLASGKDWFSSQEHYHVDGGANLPGYYGTHIRGKNFWAINMTIPVMSDIVSLFAGMGQVANDWSEYTIDGIRTNAGFSLSMGPMRLMFPLWISRPEEGKKKLDWRWTIGFGGSGEGMSIKF